MKRIVGLSLTVLACLILLSGCHIGGVRGSGVRKTEKRDLAPFTVIDTTGAFSVEVSCQKPASFEIEGDDNILPLIKTEVRNGVLHITNTKGYSVRNEITLRISLPNLETIKSAGAGNFRVTDLKNERLNIETTGATKVTVSGQTGFLGISSSGAGHIDAHSLRATKAEVSVSGAGGVDVAASDELDVTVSGAGRVVYSGNPKLTKHVSGAGRVTKRESTGV